MFVSVSPSLHYAPRESPHTLCVEKCAETHVDLKSLNALSIVLNQSLVELLEGFVSGRGL